MSNQIEKGITLRHSRSCGTSNGLACGCRPTFQAQAWSAADRKPVRKTFRTLTEARQWRQSAQVDLRRRKMSAPSDATLEEVAERWLSAARTGVIRTRSAEAYKPSAIRSYETALRKTLLPELGHLRLSAVGRKEIQRLVDALVAKGYAPSTVCNAVLPLRAIFRWAVDQEELPVNPTLKLKLPRAGDAAMEWLSRARCKDCWPSFHLITRPYGPPLSIQAFAAGSSKR